MTSSTNKSNDSKDDILKEIEEIHFKLEQVKKILDNKTSDIKSPNNQTKNFDRNEGFIAFKGEIESLYSRLNELNQKLSSIF